MDFLGGREVVNWCFRREWSRAADGFMRDAGGHENLAGGWKETEGAHAGGATECSWSCVESI